MRTLVIVIVVAMGSAAHAQAIVLPPVEVDVGATTAHGAALDRAITTETSIGLSWAALAWLPSRVDAGVGFVATSRDVATAAIGRSTSPSTDSADRLRGGYMSLGYAIHDRDHLRIWLGGRLEVDRAELGGRASVVTGEAARIAVELHQWDAWARASACGGAVRTGSIGIGAYFEVSHRDLPAELGRDATTIGAFLRIPFLAAIGGGHR